jgi:putative phosphoribosyl transferase
MIFQDRTEAGQLLAEKLKRNLLENPLVLAIPRGGVPVGLEISLKLHAPLNVLVARKLGAPRKEELGIGAIAEGGMIVLDQELISLLKISKPQLNKIKVKEEAELKRRVEKYRGVPLPSLKNRVVILVDDGLATGVTIQAAVKTVLQQTPKNLIVAIPVCTNDSARLLKTQLRPQKDDLICLIAPYKLKSIGSWYKSFSQLSDEEVIRLLGQS